MGHPIESLGAVTAAMRRALDAGKTGAAVAVSVKETLAKQSGRKK